MHARAVALREAGGREWVGAVRDVTEVRTAEAMRAALSNRAQAAIDRGDQLHQTAAALSRAVTVDDVVAVVVDAGARGLGADGRGVALVAPHTDRLRFRELAGDPAEYVQRWSEISLGAVHPAAETVRGGRALYLSGREELSSRWPVGELVASLDVSGEHAWAMLPLTTTEAPFGVLWFGFRAPRAFSAEDRTF
nr:GAF domain-containing protein [Micromonospora sp. DSM 115978]